MFARKEISAEMVVSLAKRGRQWGRGCPLSLEVSGKGSWVARERGADDAYGPVPGAEVLA